MKTRNLLFAAMSILIFLLAANAQTTEFTYQGRLISGGIPASTPHDLEFRLFAVESGGTPLGGIVESRLNVQISNGVFTVRLNFGNEFDGAARWLEISVRPTGGSTFALLNPRQPLSSAPYSVKSLNSDTSTTSTNATQLNGIPANQYVVTSDPRMTDARPPTAGSGDYVQNRTTEQTGTNFNVSGNGTVGGVFTTGSGSAAAPSITFSGDTGTGFFRSAQDTLNFSTAGVSRMLIDPNGRVGVGGGFLFTQTRFTVVEDNPLETNGFGIVAQASGTTGFRRAVSGISNFTSPQPGTSGTGVYGQAGNAATQNIGLHGIAFGSGAANIGVFGTAFGGASNWAGYFDGNTYVSNPGVARSYINSDSNAGVALTLNNQPGWSVATANTGHFQIYNDAIGQNAIWIDKTTNNTGIGTFTPGARLDVAGAVNSSTQYNLGGIRVLAVSGGQNLFAGLNAGRDNTTGGANSFVGHGAGFRNTEGRSNSFFGQLSGAANLTGIENAYFGALAGNQSLASFNSFFGTFAGSDNTIGSGNAFFGRVSGGDNTEGFNNSFFGTSSGQFNTTGDLNVFVGSNAGQTNTVGNFNTTFGAIADVTVGDLNYASAIGARSRVSTSDTIVLGKTAGNYDGVVRPADTVQIPGTLNVIGPINGTVSNATTAVNATNATTAQNALNLGGTAASQFVQTNDFRLTNDRSPLPNSSNYIQNNPAVQQGTSSFNIDGTGRAGIFQAATQFNIGTSRILSTPGSNNLLAGAGAGSANSLGSENSFFGAQSGNLNQEGRENAFFGAFAGEDNVNGSFNSFFGSGAGSDNTGGENSFFGSTSGRNNQSGNGNAFFGRSSGFANQTGGANTFLGTFSGPSNVSGGANLFVGFRTGLTNTTGNFNTIIGPYADVVANNLNNATAIGYRASVNQSNSLVLGPVNGINNCTPLNGCDSVNVGIGTNAPTSKLQVIDSSNTGLRVQTNAVGGTVASFGGNGAFQVDASGVNGGRFHVGENGRVGIGTNGPDQLLSVNGNASKVGGGSWAVFSDERLKNISGRFTRGLADLMKLKPVRFEYRTDNALGLRGEGEYIGFSAQEVAAVVPEAVSRSANGYLQVNNDPIIWTMLNGAKEQQEQIERQLKLIEEQEKANADLRKEVVEMRERLRIIQAESEEVKRALCGLLPGLALCKRVER